MPYTQQGAMNKATVSKTALASSKLLLFQASLVPDATTTKAQFEAAEANYNGYTPGGVTITAMLGPVLNPAGGAMILSPLNLFTFVADDPLVTNLIGGWVIELAAGGVWAYGVFPTPIVMATNGDSVPLSVQLVEGNNS